jgi:Ca2+-binding EF-hand superfamily protein
MRMMQTRRAIAFGLAFGLSAGAALAQQDNPAQTGERPGQPQARENFADGDIPGPIDSLQDLQDAGKMVFKLADSNNDGLISQKEAIDLGNLAVGGFFFRADQDGDGKVTKEEAAQARDNLFQKRPWLRYVIQKANQQQRREDQPDAGDAIRSIGNLLDSNNDKAIEATEVRQAVQTAVQGLYAAADTDRDGQMSPREVNAAIAGIAQAAGQALFAAADKNNDSQLSQEEFLDSLKEPATTVFAVLDANGDKQLSQQEMQRAQQVILNQLRSLMVPEPANSPANLIRAGRTPEEAAPVPNIRIPNSSRGGTQDRSVQPATVPPAPTAPARPAAPAPGQPR